MSGHALPTTPARETDAMPETVPVESAASFLLGGLCGSGVPVGLSLTMTGADAFRICLLDASGRPLATMGPFDETEIVGAWRALSASSGLPFVAMELAPFPASRAPTPPQPIVDRRKRLLALNGRRPRFLTRRKTGAPSRRPLVHRDVALAIPEHD